MLKVIKKTSELNSWLNNVNTSDLGLVPTMGNLHEGHLSLAQESLKENKYTILTIFVNPKQFGPNEDFDSYPRTLEQDTSLVSQLLEDNPGREVVIFAPDSIEEIYPDNFSTTISISGITNILCGAHRPGHFDGVTTVVYRLFVLSQAKRAYFGLKDFQQVKVIQKMINDLSLNIEMRTIPISRDEDGLAKSSRNQYLEESQRVEALHLPKTLVSLENILREQSWLKASLPINEILEKNLADERWDYLEILDADTLGEVNNNTKQVVLLGAYRVGKTRLIDNRMVDIVYA